MTTKLKLLQKRERKIIRHKRKLKLRRLDYDLAQKINKLEALQKLALAEMLFHEQPALQGLANQNAELLCGKNILFKVTRDHGSSYATYTQGLRGSIHKNGFLYLANNTNVSLLNIFSQYFRYSNFRGQMHPLGLMQVKGCDTRLSLVGDRVPVKMRGQIHGDGRVNLHTTESYWESHGGYFIKNVMADPFKGDEQKRERFLHNRQKMNEALAQLRRDLLSG